MRHPSNVLLTGSTGFVGKVVLHELLRRREELSIERIHVLVRPRGNQAPERRFEREVAGSPCFAGLPHEWRGRVIVAGGELVRPGLGLAPGLVAELARRTTHVIHCAATVEFDLPLHEAAAANITGSLNVLALAGRAERLQNMVSCSTSYVTPHPGDGVDVPEALVALPFCPEEAYRRILDGTADARALLRQAGLPNSYTLTKCIAERLLAQRQGGVPLVIVRPSIVSAAWRQPFPGWIDSSAAFAGYVMLIGTGYLRAVVGDPRARLDIVPVDEVATRLIDSAFGPRAAPEAGPLVRHAVAGAARSAAVGECAEQIAEFFREHPVARRPGLAYLGPQGARFRLTDWRTQKLPAALAGAWYGLARKKRRRSQAAKLAGKLDYLNRAFPYFTHNTFDFASSVPLESGFSARDYLGLVCRGVHRHLLRGDEHQLALAGRQHTDGRSDLFWAAGQPRGNLAIRSAAYVVRKALRRMAQQVTFDRPSFDRARELLQPGDLPVVIPCHRSYVDFLVCSYLFFARPELEIAIPHIAAAEEFSRIPLLGWLFRKTHAFYIKRGQGREDPELTRQVTELARTGQTLQFFIEGTRSRSRQFLQPKRGLLRCLQGTGNRCVVLPLAISYDRVPEERAFFEELVGAPKPKMTLRGLLRWSLGLLLGRVDLGRIHIACGRPLALDAATDVHAHSRAVVGELQAATVTTTHHLRCFVERAAPEGLTADWLREALLRRGGRVLDSQRRGEQDVDPVTERCMRHHWEHLFYPEALAACPGKNPAIEHHVRHNGFHLPEVEPELWDPKVGQLLQALFEPVCREYQAVARALGRPGAPLDPQLTPQALAQRGAGFLPVLTAAFALLVEREMLVPGNVGFAWGPRAAELDAIRARCAWPEQSPREDDEPATAVDHGSNGLLRPTSAGSA